MSELLSPNSMKISYGEIRWQMETNCCQMIALYHCSKEPFVYRITLRNFIKMLSKFIGYTNLNDVIEYLFIEKNCC
jgi:hypothetical protein